MTVMLAGIGGATYVGMHGHDYLACAMVGTPITGVVIAFLKGSSNRTKERIQKTEIMAGIDQER